MLADVQSKPLTLGFLTIAEVEPVQLVRTAAAAGFEGVSLRITGRRVGDPWFDVLGNASTLTTIARTVRDEGIRLSNLSTYYLDGQTTAADWDPALRAADALDCRLFVQGCFDPVDSRLIDTLGEYARSAASFGIRIGIEFMPASSVRNFKDARRILASVGAPNLGLVIDSLHWFRAAPDSLDEGALAQAPIYLMQICDGASQLPPGMTLMSDALDGRLYPGSGALDLGRLSNLLPAGLEVECEMPCDADRGLPAIERAIRAKISTSAWLAAARQTSRGI